VEILNRSRAILKKIAQFGFNELISSQSYINYLNLGKEQINMKKIITLLFITIISCNIKAQKIHLLAPLDRLVKKYPKGLLDTIQGNYPSQDNYPFYIFEEKKDVMSVCYLSKDSICAYQLIIMKTNRAFNKIIKNLNKNYVSINKTTWEKYLPVCILHIELTYDNNMYRQVFKLSIEDLNP